MGITKVTSSSVNAERIISGFDVDGWTDAPLRLQQAIWLNASREAVFALIADHGRITEWFPLVEQVDVCNQHADAPGGIGAMRCCTLTNGAVMMETILACNPSRLFGYAIHEDNIFGLRNHLGLISLDEANDIVAPIGGDDSTFLTWRHYFNHTNPVAMVRQLDGNLRVGLQNLINQFGGDWRERNSSIDKKTGE